jgi:hypothetical protein
MGRKPWESLDKKWMKILPTLNSESATDNVIQLHLAPKSQKTKSKFQILPFSWGTYENASTG